MGRPPVGHLERGGDLRLRKGSGAGANLLAHREALFAYAFVKGVSPTHNPAEYALSGFVMWREHTAGTRRGRGDHFAERVVTTVHTLRKQDRHVPSYLEQASVATLRGAPTAAFILHDPQAGTGQGAQNSSPGRHRSRCQ